MIDAPDAGRFGQYRIRFCAATGRDAGKVEVFTIAARRFRQDMVSRAGQISADTSVIKAFFRTSRKRPESKRDKTYSVAARAENRERCEAAMLELLDGRARRKRPGIAHRVMPGTRLLSIPSRPTL